MPNSVITKQALADSLKQLMKTKSFEKISVSETCKKCGITRKSFYYHFKDKYDLVNWIFDFDFMNNVKLNHGCTLFEFLDELLRYFYLEHDFYKEVMRIEEQNGFRDIFLQDVEPIVTQYASEIFKEVTRQEQQYFIAFFCEGIFAAIYGWIESDSNISAEELIPEYHFIVKTMAERISKSCDK